MRRAYWSADFAEAHIVEAMLRAHGVQAWVFDALIVRQDWFRTLAFGGYRVMIADEDAARAADVIGEYRTGALAVADEAVERPRCPQCATPGRDDAIPRRLVFATLIAAEAAFTLFLMSVTRGSEPVLAFLLCGCAVAAAVAVIMATRYLKGRYACPQCATRWRMRPLPFAAMAREVEVATGVDGLAKGENAS